MSTPKFKIGQKLQLTQQFCEDYKRLFGKRKLEKSMKQLGDGIVQNIHNDGIHTPIYIFSYKRDGQWNSFAECHLQAVD